MKNIFYGMMFMLVLAGCRNNAQMTGVPEKIVEIPGEIQTSFYDNVADYGVLHLETTDESLISQVEKIRIHNGMVYILNGGSNANLLCFDNNGRFVRKIGRRGRGPKEYIELWNFEIDPIRNELLLLDNEGQKILVFDLNGDFRREVKIPYAAECVGRLPDGNFILSCTGSQLMFNDYYVIVICDEEGRMLERHIKNEIKSSVFLAAKDMMTVMDDGSISLMPQYHNMVYRITDEGVSSDLGFEIPGETIAVDNFDQDFAGLGDFLDAHKDKNYMCGDHAETDEYLFFYNKGLTDTEHVFYNKTNGKCLRAKNPLFGMSMFIDHDGYCWASVDEATMRFSEKNDDEMTKMFLDAFEEFENAPLIRYKLKMQQ